MRIALRPLKTTTTTCRGGRTFYSDPSFHTSRFESSSATGSSSLPLARTRQWQPFRRYAASATSPITSSDRLDNQPSPSSSTPSPSPVKGAMQIRSRLREIRTLLEEEIGGSEEWTHRLDSAIGDVESQRRGRIGGLFFPPETILGGSLTVPQFSVTTWRTLEMSFHPSCKTRLWTRTNQGEHFSHVTLVLSMKL